MGQKHRLTEFGTVFAVDTTTVNDPRLVCDLLRDGSLEPLSDIVVCFLSLLDGSDFAGSDSPDWLVWK